MTFDITKKDMGQAFDGPAVCTFVDKLKEENTKSVIFIHGYEDYCFREEMADKFLEQGFNFRTNYGNPRYLNAEMKVIALRRELLTIRKI